MSSYINPYIRQVLIQDQTTPAVFVKFNKINNETTIAVENAKDDTIITVASGAGIIAGDYIIIFSSVTDRYYVGAVLNVNVNQLTLDTPIDSVFPIGANVTTGITNMAVNGSVTPQVFGVRGAEGLPTGVDVSVDITRLIMFCQTASAVDLEKFGDLTKLTKGLVLRHRNSMTYNIFNVKSNAELAGIAFDWTPYVASNPALAVDGFVWRLTFGGQEKVGVVQRLKPGEDLELVIQDNLSGLEILECMAEGHVVDE